MFFIKINYVVKMGRQNAFLVGLSELVSQLKQNDNITIVMRSCGGPLTLVYKQYG